MRSFKSKSSLHDWRCTAPQRSDVFASVLIASAVVAPSPVLAQSVATGGANVALPEIVIAHTKSLDSFRQLGDAAGGLTRDVTSAGILGTKSVLDTPFSVTGFTGKLIRDQQAQLATEVLQKDASVTLQNTFGYFADQLNIRGFSVGLTDRLYDGAQVGYLNKFALEGVERVEILKGPAAILYGMGAQQGIGGIVDFVPKRALPFDYTSVTASYVSPGFAGTNVDISRRGGDKKEFGIRFNGAFDQGRFANDTRLRHELTQLNLDWAPFEHVRLATDFVYAANFNNRDQLPFTLLPGVPVPQAPSPSRNYAQTWNYTYNPSWVVFTKGEVDLNDSWTVSAHYRHSHFDDPFFAAIPTLGANGDYTITPFLFKTAFIDGDGGQANLRGRVETGALRHELNVGTDVEDDRQVNSPGALGASLTSNIYQPSYYPAPSLTDGPGRLSNETLVDTFYASDLVSLPNDRIQALGAVRYIQIRSGNFDPASGAQLNASDQGKAVPIGALLFHPTKNTLLYASYAQGFQQGDIAPAGALNANSRLPPVPSEQVEVGAKAQYAGLTATIAGFRISRSLAFLDAASLLYVQEGLQTHTGFDASLSGALNDWNRVIASVMYLDPKAENTGSALTDGKRPIGVPRFQTSLFGETDMPFLRGLSLNGGAYYVGPQYVDLANTQQIPGWVRFDAGLRYRTSLVDKTATTLRFGVENIADLHYWQSAASGLGLGAPRTYRVSLQTEF